MLRILRGYDAVFGAQVPFVPYLANMPFILTQSGSDIRIVANRGDSYGALHRAAYRACTAFLLGNPWSLGHARRLGLRNMIYVPPMIDENVYRPGPRECREEWQQRVGGSFFVLSTARLNDEIKGSSVALRGFARFAEHAPEARLVIIEWGQQKDLARRLLADMGLMEKTVFLPMSGKRRLIRYLRSADCLLDQFVMKQLGSTAREALACGLPVAMNLNPDQYNALTDGPIPVLNAANEVQISVSLARLYNDRELHSRVSAESRQWFLANYSADRWAKAYRTVLTGCALGLEFDYRASPLMQPLDGVEQRYHREGLRHAPPHP